MPLLNEHEFHSVVAAELGLPEDDLRALTFEQLGLDSLQLFEIDLVVEELGVLLDEETFMTARRVADIYAAYAEALKDDA
jgi:acyl carrier protein